MSVDRFDLDLGLVAGGEPTEETRALKRGNFVSFLRAGGVFSWSDWLAMNDETCQIAEEAGRGVKGEQMQAVALHVVAALRGPVAAQDAPKPPDARRDDFVRGALERAVSEAVKAPAEEPVEAEEEECG